MRKRGFTQLSVCIRGKIKVEQGISWLGRGVVFDRTALDGSTINNLSKQLRPTHTDRVNKNEVDQQLV